MVRVAAVKRDTFDLRARLAGEEIASTARIAIAAVSAVPAHSDPLTNGPSSDAGANSVDHSNDLMSRHPRVLNARQLSVLGKRVAVTDSAGLHLDANRPRAGLWDVTFHNFKGVHSGEKFEQRASST
jgi:hypothetical protein